MRTVDPAVERAINALSPRNLYDKPVYRAMWSADRFHWAAGWWNDYDKQTGALLRRIFEARYVPKYQMAARWVIEKWCPPEFFGPPEMWAQVTQEFSKQHNMAHLELGPYPSEGDYVSIWTCSDNDGSYLELTPTLAQGVVEINMLPVASVAEMRADAQRRKEREDQDFSKRLDDILGDPFPFLGRISNVTPTSLLDKMREQRKRGQQL